MGSYHIYFISLSVGCKFTIGNFPKKRVNPIRTLPLPNQFKQIRIIFLNEVFIREYNKLN